MALWKLLKYREATYDNHLVTMNVKRGEVIFYNYFSVVARLKATGSERCVTILALVNTIQ